MARKRKEPDTPTSKSEPRKRIQFNVGVDPPTAARVTATADTFGLDEVSFIRMMLRECLPIYERRAANIRDGMPPPEHRG